SGKLIGELLKEYQNTTDVVQEVAAASREQATGVDQVNKAMSEVDAVAQRNAATAEELASTAEELSAQARALAELISSTSTPRGPAPPTIGVGFRPQSQALAGPRNGTTGGKSKSNSRRPPPPDG